MDPLTPEQAMRLARVLLAEDDEEPARYGEGAMPLLPAPLARPRPLLLLLRVLAFALIGAAATVVVAWTLDVARPLWRPGVLTRQSPEEQWALQMHAGWPDRPLKASLRVARGRTLLYQWFQEESAFRVRHYLTSRVRHYGLFRDESGWPLLALRGYAWSELEGTGNGSRHQASGWIGWRPPKWWPKRWYPDVVTFPLLPIWPGFAVDTALYGGLAFIVWSAPGFVRRRGRRRRGRCVRCGYELAGVAVCPECGGME